MEAIYTRLEIPDEGRETAIQRAEGEYIHGFVRERKPGRTLETGLAYGCSAAHIMMASEAPHIAIDPYQEGIYKNAGVRNVEKLGLKERFQLFRMRSAMVLPFLATKGTRVDFAFIDASHLFEEMLVEFYYISGLLNRSGCVMFHDVFMPASVALLSYIRTNRKDFTEVRCECAGLCAFEKVGEDTRDWMHYEPFSAGA